VGVASPRDKGRRHMACTAPGAWRERPGVVRVNWMDLHASPGAGLGRHGPPAPASPDVSLPRRSGAGETPRLPGGACWPCPARLLSQNAPLLLLRSLVDSSPAPWPRARMASTVGGVLEV
jgi:hypothetical protein